MPNENEPANSPQPNNGPLLPPDPNQAPLIMGDPYDGKTPKTAQEKWIKEHSDGETNSGQVKYAASTIAHHPDPWLKNAQVSGANTMMTQPMWFSPLHTPQNWQIASKRREVYQWNRFWYDNEPKVAAAIDFYSRFPMNGFRLECPSKKVLNFFENNVVKKLKLNEMFKMISSEYFMLGDVFIHLNVSCPICNGSGRDPDTGEKCDHRGGTFNRIVVLNPDWIEVQQSPLVDEPQIALNPDEELKNIVFYKQPKAIYDRIPDFIKELVIAGKPIPLSNRTTHHLKHMAVPYGTYGTSLARRLFVTLAYKTKIMTANWIVAERLILPVRVVKVGNNDRPASATDIADVQQLLGATANDPNLTIVTHHAFEYEWYGATGKILQVTSELEWIGKEILDGFMLNQSLLNGEMCIPEQDQMLTLDGLKSLSEITENDYIATYNKNDGTLEYQKPTAIHVYDYDGELVHFQTDRLDFACTPNHRMLFKKRDHNEWTVDTANNVRNRARFVKNLKWDCGVPEEIKGNHLPDKYQIGTVEIPRDEYLKIVAYYLTEGHIGHETRKHRSSYKKPVSVYISQSENGKGWNELCSLKKTCTSYRIKKSTYGFAVYNKELADHLSSVYGELSHRKYIPSILKSYPVEELRKFLGYLINGDGSLRTRDKNGPKKYYTYFTKSRRLRDDVVEIALKCGYFPRFRKRKTIWEVTFSDYDLGQETIPLDSKKHETITYMPYKGRVWCVTVPNGFIVSERNGKLMVSGNSGYQSAQVGVETLIRRIESWRHTLAEWCEENIFKPIAQMQGFIDEEKSSENAETIYMYPTIKWNDLELKDKQQWYQLLVQLHDKQVISTQTLMEELQLNYDQEIKRMRYEQMQAGPGGAPMGGMGGGGGMPPMGGGGGGGISAPGGGAAAPGMGGDMSGGMGGPGMGGPGGAPGGDMGGGGGMGASAGAMKVMKKGKGKEQEQQNQAPVAFVKLTQIEQKMAQMLEDIAHANNVNPQTIVAQFPVENPKGGKRFQLDFAMPHIKLGVECDGEIWHNTAKQEMNDKERDYLLAQRGWTILRFDDKVIDEAPQSVKQTINEFLHKLTNSKGKKASTEAHGLHTFTKRGTKLIDLGDQYDKYFASLSMYHSEQIGSRGEFQNIEYKNKAKQSGVFKQ